jgi:RNA polymerase sigma-70 factor (ECF subfamily)
MQGGEQQVRDQTAGPEMLRADSLQFEEVASRYSAKFYRHAFRCLRNEQDAEDAVQEALLAAHRHLSQFKGNARLSTWVMAIVINSVRQHFRRRQSYHFVPIDPQFDDEDTEGAVDLRCQRPNPEQIYADAEQRTHLLEAMNRLPVSQRKVYQMRDLEGQTTRQVADALGISEGAVKAYLFRARMKLGRSLSDSIRSECRRFPQRHTRGVV